MKRIGILTGGGDCPGLNAVIRAVTKSAVNDFGQALVRHATDPSIPVMAQITDVRFHVYWAGSAIES